MTQNGRYALQSGHELKVRLWGSSDICGGFETTQRKRSSGKVGPYKKIGDFGAGVALWRSRNSCWTNDSDR